MATIGADNESIDLRHESLVRVGSFWSPFQADLAVARLKLEGIEASLECATLIHLNWSFANAVRGVKVLTLQHDALRAASLVLAMEEKPHHTDLSTCEVCGEQLPLGWDFCWKCAPHETLEISATTVFERKNEEDPAVFSHLAIGALLIVFVLFGPFALVAIEVLALVIWRKWKRSPRDTGWSRDDVVLDDDATLSEVEDERSVEDDALEKAWRAAVFGMCSPLFSLLACWHLITSGKYLDSCSVWQKWRWRISWFFASVPFIFLSIFLYAMFSDSISFVGAWMFDSLELNRKYVGR